MIGLFKRKPAKPGPDTRMLGADLIAMRVPAGTVVPRGCVGVVFDKGGRTRRIEEGARIDAGDHEGAFCFHPGPASIDVLPFPAAPELGLRLSFVVDAPDPRVAQQRFDLYLASEAGEQTTLEGFGAVIEAALQRELAQGNLELPPCTSLDEWDAFRTGLNQFIYTRFGFTVDDCVPVDLADSVDYAALLLARAQPQAALAAAQPESLAPAAFDAALADAQALRRLFLELPCVTSALRLATLPPGLALFRQHQELLARLDRVGLSAATMPALTLAAPGQPLAAGRQAERARHSSAAAVALDEAWAMLARLAIAPAPQLPPLLDDADRIVANLEHHCAARRLALQESEQA